MSLTKEQFLSRIFERENDYLFRVPVLATPNEDYVKWAYEYIKNNEIENKSLKNIKTITRNATYNVKRESSNNSKTSRKEEHLVIDLYNEGKEEYVKDIFGEILNYQVPLKNDNSNKGIKAIDFINKKGDALFLSEIKYKDSNESILKAILEIQTYYQIIDHNKLLKDFGLNPNTSIRKSVVIFKNTKAYKQLENEYIKELINLFNIDVIVLKISEVIKVN